MTEDLTDGAFAILELLAIPVLVPVALGLAAWRWLRKPPRVDLPIAPTAHRGAELGKLAEDHRKGRTIKNGELYLAARARKAQEDDRCDARAMEAVQAMAPPDPAAAEQGEREGVPRRDRGAGGQAMTPDRMERGCVRCDGTIVETTSGEWVCEQCGGEYLVHHLRQSFTFDAECLVGSPKEDRKP